MCLNSSKLAARLEWGDSLVRGGDQVDKVGSSWTGKPFKAWEKVYSEGGRNPLDSNSPIHISK